MKFAHMVSDTSHGPRPDRAAGPQVVRCGSCRSASLSNSIVNATRAWDATAENLSSATRTVAARSRRLGFPGWRAGAAGRGRDAGESWG